MALLKTGDAGNYLRVRGEYFGFSMVRTLLLELPPRARRIPCAAILYYLGKGTTSACAENTVHARSATRFRRNYLRVRGEYVMTFWMDFKILELPPRARRIHKITAIDDNKNGTTSACAENTLTLLTPSTWPRNYLRVRGEYTATGCTVTTPWELPPRARRIRGDAPGVAGQVGTTSACAENTRI